MVIKLIVKRRLESCGVWLILNAASSLVCGGLIGWNCLSCFQLDLRRLNLSWSWGFLATTWQLSFFRNFNMSSSHWSTPFIVLVKCIRMTAFLKIVTYLIGSLRKISESLHVVWTIWVFVLILVGRFKQGKTVIQLLLIGCAIMIALRCASLNSFLVVRVTLLVVWFVLSGLDCAWGSFVLDGCIVSLVLSRDEVVGEVSWSLRLAKCLSECFLRFIAGCYFASVSKDRSSLNRSLKVLRTCARLSVEWIVRFGNCSPAFFGICCEGRGCHI